MGITGVTSYQTNTSSRITGLASNMDTDTLIKQTMKAQSQKYTKILQKRQVTEWRMESYRDVSSTLQTFYKTYFDSLSAKNIKNVNNYSGYSSTYAAANSTDFLTVTPGANAKAGTYTISNLEVAKAAKLSTGSSVTKVVEGAALTTPISIDSKNNAFEFTLNGVTKQFTLSNSTPTSTVQDYITEIQTKLNENFGENRVRIDTSEGVTTLKFVVNSTDIFSINKVYNRGAEDLFSTSPTEQNKFQLNDSNNKFTITIGSETKTIEIPAGAVFDNANSLAMIIELAVKDEIKGFGADANISFSGTTGKVTYTSTEPVIIQKTEVDANSALGFSSANLSNKIDLNSKVNSIADALSTNPGLTGTGNDIEFKINGKFFRFNSKEVSINDIIKKVNADTTINATMKYDVTTNSFKVESRNTGGADKLTVEDVTGDLMSALGVEGTSNGTDASVIINGTKIVRPGNVITYDGLTFNIKNDFTSGDEVDPIKVTIASDTSKTYDFIKEFVDKYNEVVQKLNSKLSEKVYRDYAPLTDEQKGVMSEEQIKKWEEKCKSGLLRNDSIISNTLSQMRLALYSAVEGTGATLSSIGITTSSNYEDKGKLVIDEVKLKEALASKPEEVATLFTASSDVTYYESINSTNNGAKLRSQRYKESGIAQRLSDIIQDAIRTNTDSGGYKGTLLEKAGIVGDRSEYSSLLAKELLRFDDDAYEMNKKLIAKENALYKKYAAMESAMSKLNEQSSWIAQQFSGN